MRRGPKDVNDLLDNVPFWSIDIAGPFFKQNLDLGWRTRSHLSGAMTEILGDQTLLKARTLEHCLNTLKKDASFL